MREPILNGTKEAVLVAAIAPAATSQKSPLQFFFCARPIFSSKGKENFFGEIY